MTNICPLLIRASFIGRTYHDFLLKFQSPPINNCTNNFDQDPLLIQFTRILNSTFNHTTYALYDPFEVNADLPHLQVFHNDHVDLCLRSAIDTDRNDLTCHQFYMITMLSSMNTSIWPLLIVFGYVGILFLAILFELIVRLVKKISRRIFWKKMSRYSLGMISNRQIQRKKINEKKEILRNIDRLANQYQSNRFIHHPNNGQINRGYNSYIQNIS